MNKELEQLERDVENKRQDYLKSSRRFSKLRNAELFPEISRKYTGKFFQSRFGKNDFVFIIRMLDAATAEVVLFGYEKAPLGDDYNFSYNKQYYVSGNLGKEISRADAIKTITKYVDGIYEMFPVDFFSDVRL